MPDIAVSAFTPIMGSGKRAQRKREARMYDGAIKKRARYKGLWAGLARFPSAPTPNYRVVLIREDDASVSKAGATVRVTYRPPKRRIPECERPSKVIVTKPS